MFPPARRRGRRSRAAGEGGAPAPPAPVELAIRYLSSRRRFSGEVRAHLRKKGVDRSDIDPAIERLEELGLVDDVETSRAWIQDRLTFAPRGRRRLSMELRQKGVPPETIEEVLTELVDPEQEIEAALAVARKAARGGSGRGGAEGARRRLWAALARRGFAPDVCREALRRHLDGEYASDDCDDPGAGAEPIDED